MAATTREGNNVPDGLNEDERALAWQASWNPSFAGIAIVNPDFTFRSVNSQFCEIAGVTPAEILNGSFTDITPVTVRELDVQNAKLVMEGRLTWYVMPKSYEFQSGKRVDVVLMVRGVYHSETSEFLFFVSRIMADDTKLKAGSLSEQPTGLLRWVDSTKVKVGLTALVLAALAAATNWINKLY